MSSNYDNNQQGGYPPQQGGYPPQQGGYPPQQGYQQPPSYNPPPPPAATGGAPIVPIIGGILVVALIAVGSYFLFFNKSSTNTVSGNPTPTVAASNNNGGSNTPSTGNNNNNGGSNTPSTGNNNNNGGILTGLMVQANGKSGDMLLPKETLAYFSFNAKPGGDQQANLDRIRDAFTSQAGWDAIGQQLASGSKGSTTQAADQCKSTAKGDNKNGFVANATDVLQGNVLVAFITPDAAKLQTLSGSDSCAQLETVNDSFVVIADTNTSGGDLLGKLKADAGSTTKAETYSGQDITKYTSNGSTFYLTMYGNTAVLAANVDNVKKVIDAEKNSDGLGSDSQYKDVAAKLPANRLGSFYLNITNAVALAQLANQNSGSTDSSSQATTDTLKDIKGLAMFSFTAQPNGVQVDISSNVDLGKIASTYVAPKLDPRTLLAKIPADAWLTLDTQDLGNVINSALETAKKNAGAMGSSGDATVQQIDQMKQQISQALGMDFDKDLVPLLQGETALYISPAADSMVGVGGAFVVKTGDKAKADTLAQKLAQLAAISSDSSNESPMGQAAAGLGAEGDATPTEDTGSGSTAPAAPQEMEINGGKFYMVQSGSGPAYIGTIDDLLFISYSKGAIENWGKSGGLSSSDVFKRSTDTTEKPNGGLMFVDIKAIRLYVEKMFLSDAASKQSYEQYKPLIAPFEGMAITNTQYDAKSQHLVIFFNIEKP